MVNGGPTLTPRPIWDPSYNIWDVGVADGVVPNLDATNTLLSSSQGLNPGGAGNRTCDTNPALNPHFVNAYLVHVQSDPYRLQPRFRPSTLITINLPNNVLGDYHIANPSSAIALGAFSATAANGAAVHSPGVDVDTDTRPTSGGTGPDAGADQAPPPPPAPNAVGGGTGLGGGVGLLAQVTPSQADQPAGAPTPKPAPKPAPKSPPKPAPLATQPAHPPVGAGAARPPAGAVINAVTVGTPNAAGNAPVKQVFGPPMVDGRMLQGQPISSVGVAPAAMPGGVDGGGHYSHSTLHHATNTSDRGSGRRGAGAWGWLIASLGALLVAAGTFGGRIRASRRRGLHRLSAGDVRRPLTSAGKGASA
jgi:hypothetical protein